MSDATPSARVCNVGGYLVGPKARLPDDVRYFQTPGAKFVVGCNRLKCKLCGEIPRQIIGFRDGDPEAASKAAQQIFNTSDLSTSPYLVADEDARLYVCACSLVIVTGDQTSPFPNGTWNCAGHPAVEAGTLLPPMTENSANAFVLKIMNSQIQQAVNLLAITFTDGTGLLATPANVGIGGGMPRLKLWTDETTTMPMDLDFALVAGGCVQLTDKSLWAY